MNIEINYHLTQAVSPVMADAVSSTLQPLLGRLHAAGGIYQGDVIAIAGTRFRVVSRCWHLNEDERKLELGLAPA